MGNLILTLLTVFVASTTLYLVFRLLSNFKPSKKKVAEDLKKMREELINSDIDLVPLSKEELELFSQQTINQLKKKRATSVAKGVFTTIFDEPIVAYSYKKYVANGTDAVLYARTADHEFAYRIQDGDVKIVIDNQLVGTLKPNGVLYGGKKEQMIARINRDGENLIPVIINDKKVGNLTKALPSGKKSPVNQRAFEFLREDLNQQEEQVFLSLALFELINRTLES